jgi:NAD(P)-dependent dehydrogenase (short-subunit alcohol dehydrogenase family)
MPIVNSSMQGKICMVTGANSGIGKATALALAQMGATVVYAGTVPKARKPGARSPRKAGITRSLSPQAFDARKMEMLLHRKCDLAA